MNGKWLCTWLLVVLNPIWLAARQDTGSESDDTAHEPQPLKIATFPDGSFYIERDAESRQLSVVSVKDNAQRWRLPPVRVKVTNNFGDSVTTKEVTSDQLESTTKAFISPDANWIFVGQLSDDGVSIGILYRRSQNEQNGNPRFELFSNDRFDDSAYQFFADQEKVDRRKILLPASDNYGRQGIEFVAWSSDSCRLLVTMSATLDAPKETPFPKGVTAWFCYFNTRISNFELTERLRKANLLFRSFDPWKPMSFIDLTPRDAEAVGKERPIDPITERFNQVDRQLNEVYSKLMKQLSSADKANLRTQEQQWLITRDTDAMIYATQSWNPFIDAMILEGKANATEERTRDLEKRVGLGGNRMQSQ